MPGAMPEISGAVSLLTLVRSAFIAAQLSFKGPE